MAAVVQQGQCRRLPFGGDAPADIMPNVTGHFIRTCRPMRESPRAGIRLMDGAGVRNEVTVHFLP